jgi:hypothetical protein
MGRNFLTAWIVVFLVNLKTCPVCQGNYCFYEAEGSSSLKPILSQLNLIHKSVQIFYSQLHVGALCCLLPWIYESKFQTFFLFSSVPLLIDDLIILILRIMECVFSLSSSSFLVQVASSELCSVYFHIGIKFITILSCTSSGSSTD